MNVIEVKEKFSFNLMYPESAASKCTILYTVYRTIEKNGGISLSRLQMLMHSEYGMMPDVVQRAVAALTGHSLFNCVSRWQHVDATDYAHLRARPNPAWHQWLAKSLEEFPELAEFEPPVPGPTKKPQQRH